MNKSDLISKIAHEADISKSKAETALVSILAGITEALKHGESVTLTGFGAFSVKRRPERKGRNPQTGEVVQIQAATVPLFKAGKNLKNSCNN